MKTPSPFPARQLLIFTALFGLCLLPLVLRAGEGAAAVDLKTDYRMNPMGLDRLPPALSWRMDAADRPGAMQTGWRIQSASSSADILAGRAAWDSGKVDSEGSWQIPYGGPIPKPGERVWWRVKIWDENGAEGPWSEPAWFEAGVADDPAWGSAEWIGCDRTFEGPEPAPAAAMGDWISSPDDKPIRGFSVDMDLPETPVVSAMAWWGLSNGVGPAGVSANYETHTGHKRTPLDRVMRPAKGGAADLAFHMLPGRTNQIDVRFKNPARKVSATMGMKIVFADGTEKEVRTGKGWKTIPAQPEGKPAEAVVAGAHGEAGVAHVYPGTNLAPIWLRGIFSARKEIRAARLHLCALGQGIPFLNGTRVSDSLLNPPQSDYETAAYYVTHDITGFLRPGENALAVLLDAGWYHQVGGFGALFSYGRPGLKALVAIDYADGSREIFPSGTSWQWKESRITAANVYRGEKIDFRLDEDSWKSSGAGKGWNAVQVLPPLTPRTTGMDVLPARALAPIKPVRRWQIGAKTWLYDMGEVLFGYARFTVDAPAGETIRLRYSEYAKDGVMENVPGSQWWCHGVTQGDEIISGGMKQLFEPLFTTKSFRFVEVSGTASPPEDLVAVPVSSSARPLASFESSDTMLNTLFTNGMRTWRNYVAHVTADIPRERCLWGAESIYTTVPATYCRDYPTNHRFMLDLWCTGAMTPEGIPGNIGVGKRLTTMTQSFAWSVTPVFIASDLTGHYGDAGAVRPHYALLRQILRHAEETGEKGGTIPVPHNIGDHAPPHDVKRKAPDNALVNAMIFFDAQQKFARIAEALGHPDDASHARQHAGKIRATIMEFFEPKLRSFGSGTLDSLALASGILSEPAELEALAASLAGHYRRNGHQFDGGFLSHEIYPQLSRFGYADDALKTLVNTGPPGPARSVAHQDATTFWEAYYLDHDFQMFRGLDFVAFTHSIGWMLTDLAGMRYECPAGRRAELHLAPHFPDGIDWVRASLEIPSGTVRSEWKREGDTIAWKIVVPPNSAATVKLPPAGTGKISVNRKPQEKPEFELPAGVWEVRMDKGTGNPD